MVEKKNSWSYTNKSLRDSINKNTFYSEIRKKLVENKFKDRYSSE